MHTGELGGANGGFVAAELEAVDVGGDRVGEELDVLRQVAEMAAKTALGPLRDVGAVQAYDTDARRQHADELAHQTALARARRAEHAQPLPRGDLESAPRQGRP